MLASVVTDMFWFIKHLYKMDLDKSITKKTKAEEISDLPEIHRRTYKKMLKYFSQQNDQLVLERHVAEDLRKYLDVDEGIRCLIFGKPSVIPEDKIHFYLAYAKHVNHQNESDGDIESPKPKKSEETEEDEDFFFIERIVSEYSTIKTVLINNSFPVDLATLSSGGDYSVGSRNTKGWGMRVLFDKKIFLALLLELAQMRKINSVKKQFYIFNIQYRGKMNHLKDWRKKVDARTTQTLKFMNLSRILRIIRYDPALYMNQQKMSTLV